jgi:hypothetical protein
MKPGCTTLSLTDSPNLIPLHLLILTLPILLTVASPRWTNSDNRRRNLSSLSKIAKIVVYGVAYLSRALPKLGGK